MPLDVKTKAVRRSGNGLINGQNAGDELYASADSTGNFLYAKGGADYTEMARAGGVWNVISAASTPLVVIPTTLTILEVYNNSSSSMVMEILDVFCFHLLGTAALHQPSIWAQVTAPKAAPSTGSLSIGSQSGRAKYTDTATTRVTTGAGTTVIANGWRPFGVQASGSTSTATPAEAWNARIDGALVVPQGCSVCVTVTDTLATASSVQVGVSWNERYMAVQG